MRALALALLLAACGDEGPVALSVRGLGSFPNATRVVLDVHNADRSCAAVLSTLTDRREPVRGVARLEENASADPVTLGPLKRLRAGSYNVSVVALEGSAAVAAACGPAEIVDGETTSLRLTLEPVPVP